MECKIETGDDLKQAICDLGYTQSSFIRILKSYGDPRTQRGSLSLLQKMIANKLPINPYIPVVINMLYQLKDLNALPKDPKT
ncbi:hypothetical protein [Commensalibacter oyaizuii]|uniref:Uncharacterized protein n=1 Tax=Commensalibacter oyaizuii TaxID=3043873 RepID=A0ABT6Q3A6_9PROT|nr:hypothetical protein [Commensalibacter sp. TBRC 16381]MDI2091610.1 hypothetical protein [Commensalibacter sp. TBRC 16381]